MMLRYSQYLRDACVRSLAFVLAMSLAQAANAQQSPPPGCASDAMLVFDASGSMGSTNGNGNIVPRIAIVRKAMRVVLPHIAPYRNLGLIVYGPGSAHTCSNIDLRLKPAPHSAGRIMLEIERTEPDGDTPLTRSITRAADELKGRKGPGVIVLLTDGDENCGGVPCKFARELKAQRPDITVHVIAFRERDKFGTSRGFASQCIADATGGLFASPETPDELVEALAKTLACPLVSQLDR